MTSIRHNTYLDAARASILDVGWKRTTLTDVARRANVSRMTIYRAWPDMQMLMADLMTREWEQILAAVPVAVEREPTPGRIADGVVVAIRALRENALLRRIIDLDPELLLPYLLDRRGRSQQGILDFLTPTIAAGQAAGHVREGDPAALARTVVLAAHGLVLSVHTMADPDGTEGDGSGGVREEDLLDSFTDFLVRALTP
jgi:AcrR family transcriptional regulator